MWWTWSLRRARGVLIEVTAEICGTGSLPDWSTSGDFTPRPYVTQQGAHASCHAVQTFHVLPEGQPLQPWVSHEQPTSFSQVTWQTDFSMRGGLWSDLNTERWYYFIFGLINLNNWCRNQQIVTLLSWYYWDYIKGKFRRTISVSCCYWSPYTDLVSICCHDICLTSNKRTICLHIQLRKISKTIFSFSKFTIYSV